MPVASITVYLTRTSEAGNGTLKPWAHDETYEWDGSLSALEMHCLSLGCSLQEAWGWPTTVVEATFLQVNPVTGTQKRASLSWSLPGGTLDGGEPSEIVSADGPPVDPAEAARIDVMHMRRPVACPVCGSALGHDDRYRSMCPECWNTLPGPLRAQANRAWNRGLYAATVGGEIAFRDALMKCIETARAFRLAKGGSHVQAATAPA